MKNRVTISGGDEHTAPHSNRHRQVPVPVLLAIAVSITIILAINLVFSGQSWLARLNNAIVFAGPVILFTALLSLLVSEKVNSSYKSTLHLAQNIDDDLAHAIPWTAMRPHITGESKNCRISQESTLTRFLIAPIFTLHHIAIAIATTLITTLPFLVLSDATIDSTQRALLYLIASVSLAYIAFLLRKPVRALEFNKDMGVFWIEKRRPFGWKIGESAQMPLSQIYALQILAYRHRESVGHSIERDFSQQITAPEYELNVVFRNGTRVNIINHRNVTAIRHDAKELAEFLGIVVWERDHTENRTHAHSTTLAVDTA